MAVFEFPASFAQRRMLLLHQLDPDQPTYNMSWAVWLEGPLDVGALRTAWEAAVARHEALRTHFRDESGTPVQVISDDPPATFPDAVAVDDPGPVLRDLARTPFDLARPPLLRTCLLRLPDSRHVFGIAAHHIVADGWSFRLLFDELSADYATRTAGSGEPPIQYADFALWQLEHAQAGEYAAAERFWRTELAGAPLALPLPVDSPYPPQQTFRGGAVEFPLPGGHREFAAAHDVTPFAVLLAVYAALLSRLTGAPDVLVGVPVAARTRAETEHVVGLFMNTVALRIRVPVTLTLAELVEQVHAAVGRALAYQDLPFARVVDLCRPERDPARGPVVQALFSFEEPHAVHERGGLSWRPALVRNGTAKLELELDVVNSVDGPSARIGYNADLFTAESVERFADAYRRILDALLAAPGTRVSDVDILGPATRALVLPPATPLPPGAATAAELVAAACPADVLARARAVAAALRERGVRPQDRVGVLLPRGPELLPALLGIWWLGAAYVPLDPMYPPERVDAMVADAGVRVVLSGLDGLTGSGVAEPCALPPTAAAYTIFTSGSTGRPKAVTVSQGAVAALLRAFRALLPLGPGDRWVAVTTLAFDISLLELLLPVVCGAQVVVATAEQAADPAALRTLLAGATVLQATPQTWRMLVASGGVPDSVRLRLCGGEALPRDLGDALSTRDSALWNLYGPTETTVWSGAGVVGPGPVPVGPAIPGTRLYVLDGSLRPVLPGVVGEVCIGGSGVAQGYDGAPGRTASAFVPDPYGPPGARLYRTGDLGRWRDSGRIELVGRADRQVKVRGFRVETAEIESVLRGYAGVRDAVVVLRPGRVDPADAHLAAYVVGGADPGDLREHLRRFVPEYMVPAVFVPLPELPRTPGGKVDHAALPEPGPESTEPVRQPRTPLESELTLVFADLLHLPEPVGVYDNFFVLGGFSLAAIRLMARVRERYGVDLPVRALFADPTVAGLAQTIAAQGRR